VPNIYEILASLDAARRTARRNIGDMVNDPRGYADKMLGHMQNQNAGVAPVAAGAAPWTPEEYAAYLRSKGR
jgi:hypothetical protein